MDLLKKLTGVFGMPGWENEIREYICAELNGFVDDIRIDRLGNIIAVKNADCKERHIVLTTHMDEVGLMVKSIDSGGFLRFTAWGMDKRALPGKFVRVGEKKIPGVIGIKPVHSQKPEEKGRFLEIPQLYIDIGVSSKEEASRLVSPGEFIGLEVPFSQLASGVVSARALDARVGCAAIIETLRDGECAQGKKVTAVFCAQKETGLRGSAVAANQIFADVAVNLDGVDCAFDAAEAGSQGGVKLGDGPVLLLKDASAIYPRHTFDGIRSIAEKNAIPFQALAVGKDKSDSASFQMAHGGMKVIGVGVPIRYARTGAAMMRVSDYRDTVSLLKCYLAQS